MRSFEGYLDRVSRQDDAVSVRLVTEGYPSSSQLPVVVIAIDSPDDTQSLHDALVRMQAGANDCYVDIRSENEVTITTDHGHEVVVRGKAIEVRKESFDQLDYERFAKHNYDWGMQQYKDVAKHSSKLQKIQRILREQRSRMEVKIQGHQPDTTANTLYAQQITFLSRVLSEIDS